MLKVSRDKPRASPATPKKLHYYRRTQHDSARPVAPGSCCDARTKASKKKPCSLGTGVGPSHHKAHQQQHGGTKGIKCRGDHYHKHAAASVEIEAAAQQHQIFNAISQTSPALFTVPYFFASHFQGPIIRNNECVWLWFRFRSKEIFSRQRMSKKFRSDN